MEYQKNRIKILIVDDQALFATSLRLVLENCSGEEFEVVGIASNGVECVEKVEALEPDVVLMDVYMPQMDGVEATAALLRIRPATKVMMLTTFADDTYVKKALRSGASGYVLKSIDAEELVTCVKAVYNDLVLISSSVGSWILGEAKIEEERGLRQAPAAPERDRRMQSPEPSQEPSSQPRSGFEPGERANKIAAIMLRFPELKPREAEILLLLLNGFNNHQIASELLIAEQTVRNYTSAIYTKIGVDDRLQAIQLFAALR